MFTHAHLAHWSTCRRGPAARMLSCRRAHEAKLSGPCSKAFRGPKMPQTLPAPGPQSEPLGPHVLKEPMGGAGGVRPWQPGALGPEMVKLDAGLLRLSRRAWAHEPTSNQAPLDHGDGRGLLAGGYIRVRRKMSLSLEFILEPCERGTVQVRCL